MLLLVASPVEAHTSKRVFKWAEWCLGLTISSAIFFAAFIEKIQSRGGYDWDELYLVRAASMGGYKDFINQIWPEPTPPMQAIFFKVLVTLGYMPTEQNIRFLNLIGWLAIFVLTWLFAVKNRYQIVLTILLLLVSINFFPLSYVAQARPYFFGFFLMVLFSFVWHRDFSRFDHPSRFLLMITLCASLVHVYGAITCTILYVVWSLVSRKIIWQGLIFAIVPYMSWFLLSISNARDKVARVSWMVVPDSSEIVTHIKDQMFGGNESFVIIVIGCAVGVVKILKKIRTTKLWTREEVAQAILVASFTLTLFFAFLFSNIVPIWYPRNFLFTLPLALLASSMSYREILSSIQKFGRPIIAIFASGVILFLFPLSAKALFDPNKGMSQGSYRDISQYSIDSGLVKSGSTIIGWEDTQVYEFYFSVLGLSRELELNFESRFTQQTELLRKSNITILAADEMVDPEYVRKLVQIGFSCKSLKVLNGNVVVCDKQLTKSNKL